MNLIRAEKTLSSYVFHKFENNVYKYIDNYNKLLGRKMGGRNLAIVVVAIVIVVVIAAVAYIAIQTAAPPTPTAPAIKLAAILPGPINDGGWNTLGFIALTEVENKTGVKYAYSEYVSMADAERVAREYIASGYNVILFHGGEYTSVALSMPKDFPDATFILVAAKMTDIPTNLWIIDQLSYNVTCYLCGRVAGMITKTGVVGWVGGMDLPHGLAGYEQFKRGATEQKPGITVLPATWLGDFNDPVKGRDATTALIAQGADVIYAWTDLAFFGSVEAAKTAPRKVWLMGVNSDRGHIDPDIVVTSSITNFGIAYPAVIKEILAGKKGGIYGLVFMEGTYLAPIRGGVSADVEANLKKIEEDILAGKISIPDLYLPKK